MRKLGYNNAPAAPDSVGRDPLLVVLGVEFDIVFDCAEGRKTSKVVDTLKFKKVHSTIYFSHA